MGVLKSSRQTSQVNRGDKALVAHCTRTSKACLAIQAELDRISGHGTIPRMEIRELSKRVKALDDTAAIVLSASR